MPKKNPLFSIICLIFILGILNTNVVFASTSGTIDSTYKYAWGENIGWINFGLSNGNILVTDSGLSGDAWSENYGWINLHANNLSGGRVTNNGNGVLGGNAWGESLGWISFDGVTIDSNGYFNGYATIASDGSRISFNCANTSSCGLSDFKVRTDWRAGSSGGSSGGSVGRGGSSDISCTDGIKNGDETGIDCGGSCPQACAIVIPTPEITPSPSPEVILKSGPCPTELLITENLKLGARDGQYNAYDNGIVKQVATLQTHVNRILAAVYKEAVGPVDGIFGKQTKLGVKRLQITLNTVLKPKPLLAVDGIVGSFTKAAINNSCGNLNRPTPVPLPTPGETVDSPKNIPTNNPVVGKNVGFVTTGNKISIFVNTHLIKPIENAFTYTSFVITTILTNFWHGFFAPIINLFK